MARGLKVVLFSPTLRATVPLVVHALTHEVLHEHDTVMVAVGGEASPLTGLTVPNARPVAEAEQFEMLLALAAAAGVV